jgi:cytochrome c553
MEIRKHLASFLALWVLAAGAAAPAQADRTQELWELCAQCHGPAGGGNAPALAPPIAGLPEWYVAAQLRNFKGGLRGLHPEDVGGLRMYPMSQWLRDEADIQRVAAYVASLPASRPAPSLAGGDAARGATLYEPCKACHGPDGAGNQAMNAPPLVHASDWYLLSSLQKFKGGIRGGDPRNANAVLMRSFSNTLADEQAMKDVIAYIGSLAGRAAAAPQ